MRLTFELADLGKADCPAQWRWAASNPLERIHSLPVFEKDNGLLLL